MIFFCCETLGCIFSIAVDGFIAVAAPRRQCAAGCKRARVLPQERQTPLPDVPVYAPVWGTRRFRYTTICRTGSMPALETKRNSRGCSYSDIFFSAGLSVGSRRTCDGRTSNLLPGCSYAATFRARASHRASLNHFSERNSIAPADCCA